MQNKQYKQDMRVENLKLHYFYVRIAMKHLVLIDRMVRELGRQANTNMMGAQEALVKERDKLTDENAAYAEADEFLNELRGCWGVKLPGRCTMKEEEEGCGYVATNP